MVYRKVDWDSQDETREERRKRQRREGMARGRIRDPDKYNKKALDYYYANKEEISTKRKEYWLNNKEKQMLINAKHRAKKKQILFDIDEFDIIIPQFCPITGIELVAGDGKIHAASPTLDRIDNSKGYIKGNVSVISNRANTNKGDLSIQEIEQLYKYVKGINYHY